MYEHNPNQPPAPPDTGATLANPYHPPVMTNPLTPVSKPRSRRGLHIGIFATAGVLAAIIIGIGVASPDNASSSQAAVETTDNGQFDRESEQRGEPAVKLDPNDWVSAEPEPEPESELTVSQEQAIISAESYLRTVGGFSRSGLIDQLEYEGFSEEDAEFAVDHLDVDWKEQAVISAESYMDNVGGFSRQSLIDQLEFEGFTRKQAEHGANEVGL